MSEQVHIYISAFSLIFLILYCFFKWALKGEIFHPGLIYSFINGVFFIIFAFGPYFYNTEIDWSYYYMYAFITIAFIVGIVCGETGKSKKLVKDITLNRKQFSILYLVAVIPMVLLLISLAISTNLNLEEAAAKKVLETAQAQSNGANLIEYAITSLIISFNQIVPTVFLTYAFKAKKYIPIAVWLLVVLGVALLQNSRTFLVFTLLLLLISVYTAIKSRSQKTSFSLKQLLTLIKKNRFKIVSIIAIILLLIGIMTNARTKVRSETKIGASDQAYEFLEKIYRAQQKQWFSDAILKVPSGSISTVTELSLYAGGTVASGGVTTRIVSETGLHTWGLRNFFVFHRILSQLRLDSGVSDEARENFIKVMAKSTPEVPALLSGWLGSPGNFIMDFGYFGAPIGSLTMGWLIGWLYSSLSCSGTVINATVTSVFAMAMLLTPATNVFGIFLPSSFNFFILLLYKLTQKSSISKIRPIGYYQSIQKHPRS